MLSCRNQWGVSAFYIYGAYSIVDNGQDSMTRKFFKVYVLLEMKSLPFVGKFFCYGFSQLSSRSVRNKKPPAMRVEERRFDQLDHSHKIEMFRLNKRKEWS